MRYLDIKYGIKNLIVYFKIIWNTRPWDYCYILEMQKFQLEKLLNVIKKGNEINEARILREKDIERCIELLDHKIKGDFMERSGYDYNKFKQYTTKEFLDINAKSRILEKSEWDELWDTIKSGNLSNEGMEGWWD